MRIAGEDAELRCGGNMADLPSREDLPSSCAGWDGRSAAAAWLPATQGNISAAPLRRGQGRRRCGPAPGGDRPAEELPDRSGRWGGRRISHESQFTNPTYNSDTQNPSQLRYPSLHLPAQVIQASSRQNDQQACSAQCSQQQPWRSRAVAILEKFPPRGVLAHKESTTYPYTCVCTMMERYDSCATRCPNPSG